jgi:hypothetical protein
VIARRGENKAGQYLEAAVYGLGCRKGFIMKPDGHRRWGWRKFFGELRLVSASLSASVDRGIISSDASVKQKGSSYVAVLRSASDSVAKELPFEGGRRSRLRAPLAEPRALDLFQALRSVVPEVPRAVVDCSILEFPLADSLVMDKSRCPPGKQQAPVRCSPSNPKDLGSLLYPLGKRKKSHASHSIRGAVPGNLNSNLHTWLQMFLGFNLAMGRTIGKILGCATGPDSGPKCRRVRLGLLLPKPKPLTSLQPDFTEIAGSAPSTSPGYSSWPESTSPAVPEAVQVLSSSEDGSSQVPISKPFGFPPSPAPE